MALSAAVIRILSAGALAALAAVASAQQAYPSKPIRLVVPFPPGGSNNILARIVGQKLTDSWGQAVIVDNRPGGNTLIGTEAIAKSPPDGYSLLAASSTLVITPNLLPKLPYDAVKDFSPVATIASTELIMVLNHSVPASNMQEFVELAKAKPAQLNYGSTGTGGMPHLASELFNMMAGVKIQHIPYKGSGPAVTDLMGGQIQMLFSVPLYSIPYIKSGKVKPIAITGAARSHALPEVPTFAEVGLRGFDLKYWQGILAPAGTPKPIIAKLSGELARIAAMPDFNEQLVSQGVDPFFSNPEQFAELIKAELARYAKIAKTANIKLED